MSLFDVPPLTAWIASCLRCVCLGVSCLPVLQLSHKMKCVKAKENGETYWDTKTSGMCCHRMTKALPPDISLYLSQATSFHPLIITPFSCSISLGLLPSLFSSFRCLCSISRPCPHFMQLFLSSFLSFLPLSNTLYPSSASPPPLLIFKPPTLPCLLVFLPLLPSTTTSCRTSLPLTYSVFLLTSVLWSQPGWRQQKQQTAKQVTGRKRRDDDDGEGGWFSEKEKYGLSWWLLFHLQRFGAEAEMERGDCISCVHRRITASQHPLFVCLSHEN